VVNPIAKGFSKYKLNTNFGANPCYYWIVIIIGTRFGTNFSFYSDLPKSIKRIEY